MKSRQARIRRVVEIRNKELSERVARLSTAQQQELGAAGRVERARLEMEQAIVARRDLQQEVTNSLTLMECEEWLAVKSYHFDVARHDLLRAQRIRARLQVDVLRAREKLKQLEKLQARLASRERVEAERRERAEHDELAQLARRRINER